MFQSPPHHPPYLQTPLWLPTVCSISGLGWGENISDWTDLPWAMTFCLLAVVSFGKAVWLWASATDKWLQIDWAPVWCAGCYYQAAPGITGVYFIETPVRCRQGEQHCLPSDINTCSQVIFRLGKREDHLRTCLCRRPFWPLLTSCLQMFRVERSKSALCLPKEEKWWLSVVMRSLLANYWGMKSVDVINPCPLGTY